MRFKLLLLALLLTISFDTIANDYYVAKTNLKVRTGAGKRYSVSFTLCKGDEVLLLAKKHNWYNIEYLGKTGYVNSQYLTLSRKTFRDELKTNSNQASIINLLIITLLVIILIVILFLYGKFRDNKLLQTVTEKYRGTKSERDLVLTLLKTGISNRYIFHDLFVEKGAGKFSQTDLVVLTNVGIIVFEIKDYSGWIFGSGNQLQWTKVLAYGKQRYYFYNPIKQNSAHIAELKRQLNPIENIPYFSIIVFYGDCELRSINFVPPGTYVVRAVRVLEVINQILKENKQFSYTNENEVIRILKQAVINGGLIENQIQHNENMQDMMGTNRVFN